MYSSYAIAIVTLIAAGLATIIVFLHYEVLNYLSKTLARLAWVGRPRIAILFGTLLVVHIIEIWIFACGYMLADWHGGLGELKGVHNPGILDYVYYSSMTFTTVGYGDIFPSGPVRFISAMEALSGFMLITWSASFIYLEMARFWKEKQ
jgi:Ion channel